MRFFKGKGKNKAPEPTTVAGLPNEIWDQIFQLLDVKELLRIQRVCKGFSYIIANNQQLILFINTLFKKYIETYNKKKLIKKFEPSLNKLITQLPSEQQPLLQNASHQSTSTSTNKEHQIIPIPLEIFQDQSYEVLEKSFKRIKSSQSELDYSRNFIHKSGNWKIIIPVFLTLLIMANLAVVLKEFVFNSKGDLFHEFLFANVLIMGLYLQVFMARNFNCRLAERRALSRNERIRKEELYKPLVAYFQGQNGYGTNVQSGDTPSISLPYGSPDEKDDSDDLAPDL